MDESYLKVLMMFHFDTFLEFLMRWSQRTNGFNLPHSRNGHRIRAVISPTDGALIKSGRTDSRRQQRPADTGVNV